MQTSLIPATAKMIFPAEALAHEVAENLQEFKKEPYTVTKLPHGWQVTPVQVLKPFMPPAKPAPVVKKPQATTPVPPEKDWGISDATVVIVNMKFKNESPLYVVGWKGEHPLYFEKAKLNYWEVKPDKTLVMHMPYGIVKKRGITGYMV